MSIKPNYAEAYLSMGFLKSLKGDNAGAINALTRAIEIKPDMMSAYAERGVIYSKIGDKEHGDSDIKRSIALFPNMDTTGAVGELIKTGCR